MTSPVPPTHQEAGLKIAAVEVPSNEQLERRTRDGKWTLRQLRQTDAMVPLQSGTNQFDSQRGKTGFGMPRNTQTKVDFADHDKQWLIEEQKQYSDAIVRLQSGTNQFESQKGMTGFGTPRDVKGKHLKRIWELEFPEEAADFQQQPVNAQPQN
ncbi:CaLponIn-liKe proteins [Caenorhabditis elegans]|uniref:CaLponIn-liKe proteins n=1 Tax=Caenorhabditis elegans TaxID=6239 RepID=H2KZW0_CAEEL|nr:CaLponIn-liKe proteins [Caenorhabditis elegans]CCD70001.1 CaLponIn-liKe proteins [Caenorhabditis elegans]|eukprot:NP_001021536.1 CaLponIn-liKe proteins [Caenorhabditis elegans]